MPAGMLRSIIGSRLGLGAKDNLVMSGNALATIKSIDKAITSAQLLALNATPISLVAAPGAGRVLIFKGAQFFLDYNSTAYDGIAAGEDLSVKYTNGSGAAAATLEATGFLDATADAYRWLPEGASPAATAAGVVIVPNAALVLHMTTGEVATGNSPLYVRTYYMDIPSVLPATSA